MCAGVGIAPRVRARRNPEIYMVRYGGEELLIRAAYGMLVSEG
jgi:hypothetical protein